MAEARNEDDGQSALVLDFARYAAVRGWTNAALRLYWSERPAALAIGAPPNVRALAHAFNALADQAMVRTFAGVRAAAMSEIVLSRFTQNADLKPAVAKLALSDLKHPIDTLLRTEKTARLMWAVYKPGRPSTRTGGWIDRWLLVLAYSACVIVWLSDKTPDHRRTRLAVTRSLAIVGLG